jgi:hypothetical protein
MQVDLVPVARIVLDERNPRIAHVVGDIKNAPPQEWIPLALGQHAPEEQQGGPASTYSGLKASIRAQRGLIMPINVTPRPDGDYTVIEGNTRVAIFRELAAEGAPGNWDVIPGPALGSWISQLDPPLSLLIGSSLHAYRARCSTGGPSAFAFRLRSR